MRWSCSFIAVALLFAPISQACINAVGTSHQGKRFEPAFYVGDDLLEELTRKRAKSYWLTDTHSIVTKAGTQPDFKHLTDLAIVLIYQGRYDSAIRLLLSLEKRYPGHHETAGNLGTALELAGHDRVALRWIRIGMQRNSREHFGTEWLHARILEAKLAAARQPGYLDTRSVAGVRFDNAIVPKIPKTMPLGNDGKPVAAWSLNLALNYQLRERMQFVEAPDPVVANLLLDWANLNLAGGPIESASVLYDLAFEYGAQRTSLLEARQQYIRDVESRAKAAESSGYGCDICQPAPDGAEH